MNIDLRALRLRANFSQEELAQRITELMKLRELSGSVSQVQVSRWEADSKKIDLETLEIILAALGLSFADLHHENQYSSFKPLDFGSPFEKFKINAEIIDSFLANLPPQTESVDIAMSVVDELISLRDALRQNPFIGLLGRYDSGKTTIINRLLGMKVLPAQYQPATSLTNFIFHKDYRPAWLAEDVWILKGSVDGQRFNPKRLYERSYVEAYRLVAGGIDALKEYGTHLGKERLEDAEHALVFIDAPLLRSCTFVDSPGFASDDEDSAKAESVLKFVDAIVYCAPLQGFLNSEDLLRLQTILANFSGFGNTDISLDPLFNFICVATHVHGGITDEQYLKAKDDAARRVFMLLKDTFESCKDLHGLVDEHVLASRIVPFWAESESRVGELESRLSYLIKDCFPRLLSSSYKNRVMQIKSEVVVKFESDIQRNEDLIQNQDQAKDVFKKATEEEPERRLKLDEMFQRMRSMIADYKSLHRQDFTAFYNDVLNENALISMLKDFDSKEEARAGAPVKIIDKLSSFDTKLRKQYGSKFSEFFESKYMSANQWSFDILSFDARAAFIGGLTGLGTYGAFMVWFASLGNLGGYIAVAKLTAMLSALGIPIVGGAAAWIAAISSVGGPVTLIIGLSAVIAISLYGLFQGWEKRLARKIIEVFQEKDVLGQFCKGIDAYWDQTDKAFVAGHVKLQNERKDFLANLKKVVDGDTGVCRRRVSILRVMLGLVNDLIWVEPLGGK